MPRRILIFAAFLICITVASHAGGPAFVAGSGYNPGVEGQPLIWANGSIEYFTDPVNLSPILSGAQADALVTAAFGTWTSISGAALTATQGGHLAEDVNGSNIETNGEGVVTAPADVTPSATSTPVGIVYDYDGTVTDAILGEGAGGIEDCFTNAVYGGPDNFSAGGNIVHALIVINGICAATTAQLPDVQYRLVRVLGRTVGLGWSQANLNVITQIPPPAAADYAGFPVMHYADPISCVPITICYPNPGVPALDDADALARLYPVSSNPQPAGRIYGSVYFTDASGNAAQPMQGVNVVARLMVSNQPSRQYVVTSVSGFLFCGNAGNVIVGYLDGNGLPYNRWGSGDPTLEGFFDLGQLPIPTGQTTAEYQLSVEALDPDWSSGVEPYGPSQVTPSGTFAPVVITVANGSNAERDILMLQDEVAQTHPGSGSTYATPAPLPQGGAWGSWISGYGSVDFFEFTAQANRTASIAVTAVDETGQPTESKLSPVIGIWELIDQSGDPAPAATPTAFNSTTFAMTRLDAQFDVSETYRLAVADFRGDGRPDYFYQASLLYSDAVVPPRVSRAGGVSTLNGIGFNQELEVSAAGSSAATLSASATQMQVTFPPQFQDGAVTVQVTDPASGSFSQMIGALTYGASSTDLLLLLQGSEPLTPVGSQSANAIRVRAVAADGETPVSGATLAWNATNSSELSLCGGTSACSVLSDEAGESYSYVTPTATGQTAITIALAPAVYSPPQLQQTTLVATSTTLDLAAVTPMRWIGQGATLAVPLTVEALDLGAPMANVAVNFVLTNGTAALSAASATTNSAGIASISATVTNLAADIQVSACVAPSNAPCQTFALLSTPPSLWTLETVSGSSQFVLTGQSFQPLVMRVTDGSSAANPMTGAPIFFATTLARVSSNPSGSTTGDPDPSRSGLPVLLGSSQAQVETDQNGLASIVLSASNVGPCDVFISATAGQSTAQFQLENLSAIVPPQPVTTGVKAQGKPDLASDALVLVLASPRPAPAVSSDELFAVPEAASSNENDSGHEPGNDAGNAPAGDSHVSDCAESSAEDAFGLKEGAPLPSLEPSDNLASQSCARSKPAEANPPEKDAQTETSVASTNGPGNRQTQNVQVQTVPSSRAQIPEDKRSCQVLAADGPLF